MASPLSIAYTASTFSPISTPNTAYAGLPETGFGLYPPGYHPPESLRGPWLQLCNHAFQWFADPDIEALRICAATALSHYPLKQKACWIFVMGASSTGKTRLCIQPFSGIPQVLSLSNITPRSFLTGYGTGQTGLLKRPGGASQIWLFKDFTTVLSKDWQDLNKILGTLREVWDGEYEDHTGSGAGLQGWKGKVTILTAGTPKAERALASGTALGARFLQLALRPCLSSERLTRAALAQMGHDEEIDQGLKLYASRLIAAAKLQWEKDEYRCPPLPPRFHAPLNSLISLMIHMRAPVERHSTTNRIKDVGEPEAIPRGVQTLWLLMVAHARLSGRTEPDLSDLSVATRVALDTIPSRRRLVLTLLGPYAEEPIVDLATRSGLYPGTFYEIIEDLEALGLADKHKPPCDLHDRQWVRWTPHASGLLSVLP